MISSKKAKPILSQIIKAGGENLSGPREGDVVEAELIKKTSRQAFFDIGNCSTGVVYGIEMSNARSVLRTLNLGDRIPAKISGIDNENGYIELSISEADKQQVWQQVKELQESGEIIKVKVTGANNGGLTVNLQNLKAFLPISQLSNEHQPQSAEGNRDKILDELKKFINQELNVKIIDANPRSNKLIVSERENATSNVKELLEKYTVGQEIEGLVSGIADFGVFVKFMDNPDIEGMIHISELDHKIIENPKEIVKINDTVRVKIIDIKDGRVFLSLKALKADPWQRVPEKYKSGQEVTGKVYKFNPFGAVIDLDGEIQGMIHISKFGGEEEMKKALVKDTEYKFSIESVNAEEKRIILDIKK
ncbi:MAG: S1 RNA-binding domain-containing protein [bacterium]|nr:S1 RNA-binding domain-containing protein [bacterium]